jgi:hypothetical protein
MRLGEYRVSKGHVCVALVSDHPWLDCEVTILWRGCLLVVARTRLSGFLCIHFRPVLVRSNRTYQSFLERGTISL